MHILPTCLSLLIAAAFAVGQSSSGSALYPPGLQPLIDKANVYLSTGKFNDAIRTYTEAIGVSLAPVNVKGVPYVLCILQSNLQRTIYSIISERQRTIRLAGTRMHCRTLTRSWRSRAALSTARCS